MQSKFARDMMAQKLMSENKDNPFNSRFFQPSDAMAAPTRQGFSNLLSKMEQRDKQGTDVFPALAIGSGFAPSAGISDVLGFAPDPFNPGQTLPSFSENIDRGNYLDAGLQTLGAGGDVMLAASPFAPLLLAPAAAMKATSQIGKALRGGSKATKAVDDVKPGDIAKVVPPTDKSDGIFAFHGSAADFDEFSLSKINTGEGAQAFGYGLYFTDSKDIANFYKNAISQNKRSSITYKNKEVINRSDVDSDATLQDEVVSNIADKMYNFNKTASTAIDDRVQYIVKDLKELKSKQPIDEVSQLIVESLNRELTVLKNLDAKNFTKGKTYEVKINAVMDDLINYDIPLGQQSDNIKNILNKMKSEVNLDDARNFGVDPDDYGSNLFNYISRSSSRKDIEQEAIKLTQKMLFGKDQDVVRFLNDWAAIRGEQATGEKLLAKYGAKGIKYKADQGVGARNVPETGKNNYVIFDDKIIDIMAKYGIVGAIGVSAMERGSGASEGDILPPGQT